MGLIFGICSQTRVIHQRLSVPIPSLCSDSIMLPFKGLWKGSALPRHSVISMNDGGSRDLRDVTSRVATYRCRCRCIVVFMVSGLWEAAEWAKDRNDEAHDSGCWYDEVRTMVYETGWRSLYINWIDRLRYAVRFVSFTITRVFDSSVGVNQDHWDQTKTE